MKKELTPDRAFAYENEITRAKGLPMTCNHCDRIIYEDENDVTGYTKSGGCCRDCRIAAGIEPQFYSPNYLHIVRRKPHT